ncbi:MAG: helix-turn-helix transcriptional regulator [Lachnospiraceae bacterium]|nr:helix-turn-helix transcriptional regulator [Lachnospiraceae bacterium]
MSEDKNLSTEEKKIIKELISIREASGQSQKKLAEAVGMKQQTIAKIERFLVSPQLRTLMRLLDPFGYKIAIVPKEELQK